MDLLLEVSITVVLSGVVQATLTHRHHLQPGAGQKSPQLSPPLRRHLIGKVRVTAQSNTDPLVSSSFSQQTGDFLSSLSTTPLLRITEVDDATSELLPQVLPIPLHTVRQRGDGCISPAEKLQVTVGVEHGARAYLIRIC